MFGQTGNTSFSGFNTATQNSPFGQSAFGKPITTTSFGSGATPVFGSSTSLFNSKPTGSTTGGLFGNTATPPAFRQPTSTQPSFGGFGTTNTSTNLFGTQQNAATNLFGSSSATSAFGQANKPSGFSFGTTSGTNLFGQPQQPAQQTTPFGQQNTTTNTNLFGTNTGFGNSNTTTTVPMGTVVKFTPVVTTDSMSKNGISHSISARHCCIVAMKEYESKSYEELRFEDYQVGRKGPQNTGLFGTPAQPSPFGNTTAGTSTAGTAFGSMTGGFGTTSQSGSTGLFGKPITNFGTPATTTNSFAFNSPSSTNLFGTNSQAKPFGTAAPTPLFATNNTNQTAGTGFGGINTGQSTGFGSAFGSTQPNQSIGLFSQNKSAFNIPSTSTSTGFTGFGQTASNNTATPLFGNKTTTAGFGTSTFGTAAPSAFGTNTGFNSGQNTGSSLFNSSFKPAGQTSGFSFGNTSTSSTGLGTNTGLNLGGGTSLFGQQKPGSLFGNTGSNTTFNNPGSFGTSTFGTNSNMMAGIGTGLLNGGIASNQAKNDSVPVHQQILALVSAPFGDSPLLKNLLPASGKAEELLKPINPTSKMLNSPQYKVTANSRSPKIKARAVSAVQLSKKSLFDGLEEEDPVLSEAFQPRPNAKRLVLRPKSATNSSIQSPTENGPVTKLTGTDDIRADVSNGYGNSIEVTNKENHSQDNNRLANDRRSSTSWLKSTIPRKNKVPDDELEGQRSPFSGTTNMNEEINNTVAELRPQHNSSNSTHSDTLNSIEIPLNSSTLGDKSSANLTVQNTDSSQDADESSFSMLQPNWTMNMAKVTLRRAGYYTIPPIDKLDDYVCGETCNVPNFTVGREGYGNVYFPDSFDVYGLNLDEIVHFRHKEVIIYPDDDKKPPVGQGLNRKAQVTLDKVWPHDKSLHEPITDPQRLAAMNYEGKLRRVSAKHDTRFLEYRPETGSWVFKVDHFSKYGLSDSDEDDGQVPSASEAKKLKGVPVPQQKGVNAGKTDLLTTTNKDVMMNGGTAKIGNDKHPEIESNYLGETSIGRMFAPRDYSYEKQPSAVSPVGDNARVAGTDSHKLQLMKASFFDTNDDDVANDEPNGDILPSVRKTLIRYFPNTPEAKRDETTYSATLRSSFIMNETSSFYAGQEDALYTLSNIKPSQPAYVISSVKPDHRELPIAERTILPPVVSPVTSVLKYQFEVVPLKESRLNKLQFRCVADTGVQMGRMFRPSWGVGLTLLSLSTHKQASKVQLQSAFSQLSNYVSGRLADDITSTAIVQRLQILGGDEDDIKAFKDSIDRHLRIQLEHCVIGQDGDCPIFDVSLDTAIEALRLHCTLAQELAEKEQRGMNEDVSDDQIYQPSAERSFRQYASIVWKLCVALWGEMLDHESLVEEGDHHDIMTRREAIGEWLKSVVQKTVEQEIKSVSGDNCHEKVILSLLSACKLEDACQFARKAGDHCLALLMAQLRSGMPVKELIKQQLALWQETDVDENLTIERLKLFMIVAGEPLISSKHGTINVCEDLDWKRAFAIHLWYLSSPTCSITDVLDLYETSFNTTESEVYAAAPEPEYRGSDYDAEISNGRRIYDLCFHLLKLYCTGIHDLGELLNPLSYTANPLDYRLSWLMQQLLVGLGYTHLADHVFALTHANFATQLEAHGLWHWAIFVMLHLRDSVRRRATVQDLLLRHIEIDDTPEYAQREQFLKEELGISSVWIHQAKAIKSRINKRYGEAAWYYIQAEQWNQAHEIIIEHLAADAIINVPVEYSSAISGWTHQGQLLWEYMEITNEIQNLLHTSDFCGITYQLEALKPRLTSLCLNIDQFPCPTAKHRLCQAEIAKRTLHLARNLLVLQKNDSRSVTKLLVRLISQLPLPEDYAQQELRPIVNMRVTEVMSQ
ncbi:nuclear pore complex protein Nup98-Nup96 isoform X2 [Harpegnathos saltator]|uniref:nuclear pore complex protein Nup98-Nup96 isoform X2 n=1 Tax=Harpegnathos saltator TaxID=610380 RepID=UPI00058C3807|nr:nuclear pore complex protein Nup98-Nup96 isoform X2 [Harpegnathos saltator]